MMHLCLRFLKRQDHQSKFTVRNSKLILINPMTTGHYLYEINY